MRALENQEVKAVGSDQVSATNVRIIAATHQNLKTSVLLGSFRADLFYRLNVLSLEVPPLKDRIEDFEGLVYQLAKKFNVRFSHGAIERLRNHSWPGNIRELKNAVARAHTIYGSRLVRDRDVKPLFDDLSMVKKKTSMKELERKLICDQILYNKGNLKRTANDLGIPRSTLYERLKVYGIKGSHFPRDGEAHEGSGTRPLTLEEKGDK